MLLSIAAITIVCIDGRIRWRFGRNSNTKVSQQLVAGSIDVVHETLNDLLRLSVHDSLQKGLSSVVKSNGAAWVRFATGIDRRDVGDPLTGGG